MTKKTDEKKPLIEKEKKPKKQKASSPTTPQTELGIKLEADKSKYKNRAYLFTFILGIAILLDTTLLRYGELDYSDKKDSTKVRTFDAFLFLEMILAFLAIRNAQGFYSTKQKLLFRPVEKLESDLSYYKKCTALLASATIAALIGTVVALVTGKIDYSDTNYTTNEKLCDAAFILDFVALSATIFSSLQLYATHQELKERQNLTLQV